MSALAPGDFILSVRSYSVTDETYGLIRAWWRECGRLGDGPP